MNRGGDPHKLNSLGGIDRWGAMRPTVDRLLVISADETFRTGTAAKKPLPTPTEFYIVSPLDTGRLINGGGTAAVMRRVCRAMGRGQRCLRLVTHSALFMVLYIITFINIGKFS